MNKPAATDQTDNIEKTKKEKITIEGWLFYFLLFMVIIGLPAASTIWILTAANSNYVP
jgi:hypothetical protein